MTKTIAIRREDKSIWEKRVAVTPNGMKKLKNEDVKVLVQPSKIRIYPDEEYALAGAKITEDIKNADLIIGVKEMPVSAFREGGAYMFFSHTIKAQSHNMGMLKKLVDLKATLIDFECITDENNKRLVFFGKYAGLAGMIDTFHTLGQRYLEEGLKTIFSSVKMAYQYGTLHKAKEALEVLADNVKKKGLRSEIRPAVFGFVGYGNVSEGAQEIFDIFPHVEITPAQLPEIDKMQFAENVLVKVVFREEDTVELIEPDGKPFDKQHYFDNPELYRTKFSQFLPHLTCLVNCIFWSVGAPRLLSLEDCQRLYTSENNRLKVVGDITCDLNGSIECTTKATQPDDPSYVYDIDKKDIIMGVKGNGPAIMAVDNLPCEVSKSASDAFSKALTPFLPALAKLDTGVAFDQACLPEPIRRAVILWNGEFTPAFSYMKKFIE
jgi:alpha-aminoadipic semialdehyde synthase